MIRTATAILTALLTASGAHAQDWQVASNDRASVAMVTFENGISLGFRCTRNGPLSGFLSGLPAAASADGMSIRPVRLSWGRDATVLGGNWWNSDVAGTVLSDSPAQLARGLRQTGELHVVLPGAGNEGRNVRYVFQGPATWNALDVFLQSCAVPLTDPLDSPVDDALIETVVWRARPQPQFPLSATANQGVVRLNCATSANGRLEDCQVLGEIPTGQGFAAEAIGATRSARVANVAGADVPVPQTRFVFTMRFMRDGGQGGLTGPGRAPD